MSFPLSQEPARQKTQARDARDSRDHRDTKTGCRYRFFLSLASLLSLSSLLCFSAAQASSGGRRQPLDNFRRGDDLSGVPLGVLGGMEEQAEHRRG